MRGFLIGGITLNVLLIGWFLAVAYGGAEFHYWTLGVLVAIAACVGGVAHKPAKRRRRCEYSADWGDSNRK